MDKFTEELLKLCDVSTDEFVVTNSNFYDRLSKGGELSMIFGEGYMEKEWESKDLTNLLRKFMNNDVENYNSFFLRMLKDFPIKTSRIIFNTVQSEIKEHIYNYFYNSQTIELSNRVGEEHYDIPDVLYEHMLDSQRQYTCGYWTPETKNLEEAQQNKIKLIIDKLQIPENTEMHILDIGCGWGGLTNAILQRYPKCKIEGISISKEQIKYANEIYKNQNLTYYFCDYRDLVKKNKKYDRIVSVGMFEQVGVKNYDTFFNVCENILVDNGIFVLHTITKSYNSTYMTGQPKYVTDKWIDTYIFPGGNIPLTNDILHSSQSQKIMYHHIQNLSISYAKTLNEWNTNFMKHWDSIQKTNPEFFTETFYRKWTFYLTSCMIAFEKKQMQLTQFVFTKTKYDGMYIFKDS